MTDSFHILHGAVIGGEVARTEQIPLPVTFYLSTEILLDEYIKTADLAEMLLSDLEMALDHYRNRLRESFPTS